MPAMKTPMTLSELKLNERIPVAVLGATGTVGQRFVALLEGHPWFEIKALTASERSAGRAYGEAVNWVQAVPLPSRIARLRVLPSAPPLDCPVVFSALDAAVAKDIEASFARSGALVISNARSHRMEPDVPLLVPEVNSDHLALAHRQDFGGGGIVTNPNCSTIGLVLALKPLVDAFGVQALHVVTLQAISGGGLPGVASYEILDNVVPYIGGEEEKIERETCKILGALRPHGVEPADIVISAQCNRVPVVDGHTLCVSVGLKRPATLDEVRRAWETFTAEPQELGLPTAPSRPICYLPGERDPQPRLHRELGGGMAVSVGRLRACKLLDFRFVALSHNTLRGAAGGAVLAGELAVARGLLAGVADRIVK